MSADFHTQASALAADIDVSRTPWLAQFRARGTQRFESLPLPTLKTEDWKYTSLRRLLDADLLHPAPPSAAVAKLLPDVANRIVLINGEYAREHSSSASLTGVTCTSFEDAGSERRALISRFIGRIADDAEHPFLALNEGMTTKGLLVRVAAGARPSEPLHLVHIDSGAGVSRFARVLVVLSAASELTLIEHHIEASGSEVATESFTSSVIEAQVGDEATLVHCRMQSQGGAYQICGVYTDLERASRYELHQLTIGDGLTRNDIRVRMRAPGAECTLNGIYLCRERSHVDNHTSIEHCVPNCTSLENFHGIVMDHARAVFNGRIHIHRGAQGSAARLDNRNLLLSNEAEVDTKPELEIYADDVKCAHGATVGELDADARFYLTSRGISQDDAEALLVRGFAKARIDQMPTAWLREHVEQVLFSRFESNDER